MEIQKLKKKLLQEELRRRRKNSKKRRLAIRGILLFCLLVLGGTIYYSTNLDRILRADYSRGQSLVAQGKYDQAASTFYNLYKHHPSFQLAPQALFQSGEVDNLYLKKHQDALLAYLLVEKNYPNTELACKAQGRVAEIYKYRLMDFNRAIVAYQKLLDSGCAAQDDRVQNELADAYFQLNNFDQARIEFDNLVKNYPKSPLVPEAEYRIGVAYSLDGKIKEAEAAFRRMVREHPKSSFAPEARFALAGVLEEKGELVDALKILQDLKGRYPKAEILTKKIKQIRERIAKKKKAV
jgi:TolA-binding protein